MLFSLVNKQTDMLYGHVRKFLTLTIIVIDNIFIRFGSNLYRQIVGIPMDSNCPPFVAGLFAFCNERDFKLPLSDTYQAVIIEVSTLLDNIKITN